MFGVGQPSAGSSRSGDDAPVEDTGPIQLYSTKANLDSDGFCIETGKHWVYPINYPMRNYQLDMVSTALFNNTLVCLPTGLGKTFIAAVVMFNFYRWYPEKKIVFLAPTKPLVAQQINACFNIIGIPKSDTVELTGQNTANQKRKEVWESKRVIFATPQVLANDLVTGICTANDICCVVFDEGHRAKGNHSYCQVVDTLKKYNCKFRVLALSATPGADKESAVQIFKNLGISKLKMLTDDSPEVQKYTHSKNVEVMTVSPNHLLKEASGKLMSVICRFLARLMQRGIVPRTCNVGNLTMFQMKTYYERLSTRPVPGISALELNDLKQNCLIAMNLCRANEMLVGYGKGAFLAHIAQTKAESTNRFLVSTLEKNEELKNLITDVEQNSFEHPKLEKLEKLLISHFLLAEDTGEDTKVIIFSEYRNSVIEIKEFLSKHNPLIRAVAFVGQSKKGGIGLTQIEQKEIMQQFRDNKFNTLISTCVGEEGLDIGDVDLIICFDANKSPTRSVQRMGRTGRKRDGKVVMLLSEGKEHQKYITSQKQHANVIKNIGNWNVVSIVNQMSSPRMVPKGITPQLFKKILVIPKNDGIVELFKRVPKKSSSLALLDTAGTDVYINQLISKWQGPIPDFIFLEGMEPKPLLALKSREEFELDFDEHNGAQSSGFDPQNWTEWLASAQCPPEAPTSTDSEDFIKLLRISDIISCNRTELLTQTSEIASEASYNILDWTEKLLPPGKKKGKSSRAPAKTLVKVPAVLKPLNKKKPPLPRPMPPLFKDDDDFALPAQSKEIEPVKISASDEINRFMENLSLLCELKATQLAAPFVQMLDSVSLIASVEQEEKPDLDCDPPDAMVLDHIFDQMRLVEKKTVNVIERKTKVVTKNTHITGNFAKRARFTSTPLRKTLPKKISSSFDATNSGVSKDLLQISHHVIAESPDISTKESVAAPINPTAFEFDIMLESDDSVQEDIENGDQIECPLSPVPVLQKKIANIESSQETYFSDDLLCAAAEIYDNHPQKPSNSVSDIFKTSAVKENAEVTVAAACELSEPNNDSDDEYFSFEAIDQLVKQHEISKAKLEKSIEEAPRVNQAVVEEDDEPFADEDDLESKLNEIQQNALKKKTNSLADFDGAIILSSEDDNDESLIVVRKKVHIMLSSDEEETDFKNAPSKSVGNTNKAAKRTSEDLQDSSFEPLPVKRPKKKKKSAFVLSQANLSGDDSGDEDFTQLDRYDASFIQEHSTQAGIDMHAEYLRSIRSPPIPNKFKVPVTKQPRKSELSNLEEEDESYAEDSFCVANESSGENTEDSLELLEKQLEIKERERKSCKFSKENLPESLNPKKKQMRRVIAPVSSDSEQEVCDQTDVPIRSTIDVQSKHNVDAASSSSATVPSAAPKNQPKMSLNLPRQSEKQPLRMSEQPVKTNHFPSTSKFAPVDQKPAAFAKPSLPLKSSNLCSNPVAETHVKSSDAPKLSAFLDSTSVSRMSINTTMMSTTLEPSKSASTETFIIVSTAQVQQAHSLVTQLTTKHKLKVEFKTLPSGIDFVISERLAAIRMKIKDSLTYKQSTELANSIQMLKSYFTFGLVYFENDKDCPVPAANADYRPQQIPMWANNLRKMLCFLKDVTRVKFLFARNQDETAEYLATMCKKESKCVAVRIPQIAKYSADFEARLSFFNNLPHVNIVKAHKMVQKFPVLADLFKVCNTPAEIKTVFEIDEDAKALLIFKVLNVPLI